MPLSAPPPTAVQLVERLLEPGCPPFALLHRRTPGRPQDVVEVLLGPVEHVDTLAGIPLASGAPGAPVTDALALVPYRQIRERGFDVYDDGTPLAVLRPQEAYELPLAEVLAALEDPAAPPGAHEVRVEDGAFDVDDDAYARIVRRVIDDEIGRGEGANFVIRRTFRGVVPDFGPAAALALFARLLRGERGAYWTYTVHTAERTLVGASPEVHVRMWSGRGEQPEALPVEGGGRRAGGTVVMNPISGTYRYPPQGPSAEGLLEFLHDPKEVEELTMVVDEELKMMCAVGDLGGVVVGPRLKEMAHLAHTEYELRGRSTKDVREVLRQTMFAATVTGSPVQNACRVIERYEPRGADGAGRGYYAGALALIGRDAGGAQTLDSPILIRTADISPAGELKVPVGATLVRHSDPYAEVAETHAKAAGVLTALGVLAPAAAVRPRPPAPAGPADPAGPGRADRTGRADGADGAGSAAVPARGTATPRPRLADDIRVRAALDARRSRLAPFWLRMRTGGPGTAAAADPADGRGAGGRSGDNGSDGGGGGGGGANDGSVLVVDAEDTFTAMLAHVLRSSGRTVSVRRYDEPGLRDAALAHTGPVVLGPGPGDPADTSDAKMRFLRALTADLVRDHAHGLLGVCLGHELIAAELGLDLVRKDQPAQGAQEVIDYFGTRTTVGFYNTFTARCDADAAEELAMHGIELSRAPAGGDIHAMRGPGFAGVQFHPESVLSLDGAALVTALLDHTAATSRAVRRPV